MDEMLGRDGLLLMQANCIETGIGDFDEIDWSSYRAMEDKGCLRVYGVYDYKTLVGYAAFIMCPDLKDSRFLVATNDEIYLSRDYRGHALSFTRWIEQDLAGIGINRVHYALPVGHPFGRALTRDGFKALETVYRKEL